MVKNYFVGSFDVFGKIALVKFPEKTLKKEKQNFAKKLMGTHKAIKTVLEKIGKFHGRLRKQETRWVAGEKTKEVLYKENGCVFRFNIDDTYFSPRLSSERIDVAHKIKKGDKVLVMFAGVGVYPIVLYKYKKPRQIVGVEIGKDCCKWFKENLKFNKVPLDRVKVVQGDVKKKITLELGKFDVVIMARPNLRESFLKWV